MTEPRVLRPDGLDAVRRGVGVTTVPLVTPSVGGSVFLTGITTLEPGAGIPLHYHNCEESIVVLEGLGDMEIAGSTHRLAKFETTWVPAQTSHRMVNKSSAILRILWIYSSVLATRTVVDTGETSTIAAELGLS